MEKRNSHSYTRYNTKKINLKFYQKINEDTQIKKIKNNNLLIKKKINDISSKNDKLLSHFDSVNNILLNYIAELKYKMNKEIYNPINQDKQKEILFINKNNINMLNNYQELFKNKIMDEKYLNENNVIEIFKDEEKREKNLINKEINKVNLSYQNFKNEKNNLNFIIKNFRKEIQKTENNEDKIKNMKLKLELLKQMNDDLTNILNKEKNLNKKFQKLNVGEKNEIYSYNSKPKIVLNNLIKSSRNSIKINNINKLIKTPKNIKISLNKRAKIHDINSFKSPKKLIFNDSLKNNNSRNNYIYTTRWNTTERNGNRINTEFSNEDKDKEKDKNDIIKFYKLIENELNKKKEYIKNINYLINSELQTQFHIKNFCLECIKDLNTNIEELEIKKKNYNLYDKNDLNEKIKENENRLNIIKIIFEKCFRTYN